MSYILDALNKSDEERQRDHVPNLKTVHRKATGKSARRFDAWRGLIVALLVANLGLALAWLYTSVEDRSVTPAAGTTESAVAPSSTEGATAAPPNAEPIAPPDDAASRTPLDANRGDGMEPAAAVSGQAAAPVAETAADVAPGSEIIVPRPQGAAVAEIDPATLPGVLDLPTDIQRQIPDLTFASHIYSSDPRSRLVSINGRLSREGDRVAGNLRLLAITEEGVVLEFGSYRFRMSILRDWSFN